jgi:hypothetical protein
LLGKGLSGASVAMGLGGLLSGLLGFVDRVPFLDCVKCPFTVSSDSGKYLAAFE